VNHLFSMVLFACEVRLFSLCFFRRIA